MPENSIVWNIEDVEDNNSLEFLVFERNVLLDDATAVLCHLKRLEAQNKLDNVKYWKGYLNALIMLIKQEKLVKNEEGE